MNIHSLDATTLAARIARGEVSATDALQAYAGRIALHNPVLNAIVVPRLEAAVAEAEQADFARAAGAPLGPLHGVPITVKESFDVAGLPTTLGHERRVGHVAAADSVVVARLRAAGAIVMGKSNVPVALADWQSNNPIHGRTHNPYDLTRSAGGSSGGAAAALAAGLTALEVGSDIGGSIRMPAHFCGVFGHKPTPGLIPMRGHGLNPDAGPADLTVAGPLARSGADLELAFAILAGADEASGTPWRLDLQLESRTSLVGARIAVLSDDASFPVDCAISGALTRLAARLADAGAIVTRDPALPLPSRDIYRLYLQLLRGATAARLDDAGLAEAIAKADALDPADESYGALMLRYLTQRHADWLKADGRRHRLQQAWRGWFGEYDALICPAAPFTAFPHISGIPKEQQRMMVNGAPAPAADAYFWLGIPTVSGLPATTMPIGQDPSGLPIGAQLITPACTDRRALRLASLIGKFEAPSAYQ